MPTDEQFQTRLDEVPEVVEGIGDAVVEELEGRDESDAPLRGFACSHGDHTYRVLASPDWEFLLVSYDYDAVRDVAVGRAVQAAGPDQRDVTVGSEDLQAARETLAERLAAMDDGELAALRTQLLELGTDGAMEFDVDTGDRPDHVVGFAARKKLYPYDEGLSLQAFNDCVQRVVNVGLRMHHHYVRAVGITDLVGERPRSSGGRRPRPADGDESPIGFQ